MATEQNSNYLPRGKRNLWWGYCFQLLLLRRRSKNSPFPTNIRLRMDEAFLYKGSGQNMLYPISTHMILTERNYKNHVFTHIQTDHQVTKRPWSWGILNFEIRFPPNYHWKIKKSNSWPSLLDPCSCHTMEQDGSRHIINGLEEFQRQSESQRLIWVLQSFTYQQFFRNNETINQHWQVLQRRRWHGKPHALHSYCTCGSGISLCYDYFNVFDIDRVSPMLPCKIFT